MVVRSFPYISLYFLLQSAEQLRMEEFFNGDSQSVAQLLDRRNGGAVVPSADNIIHRGLRNAAHVAELIDRYVTFPAQFQDALFHRFADVHGYHLFP